MHWPMWPRAWARPLRWLCGSIRICRPRPTSKPIPASKGVKFGLDIDTILDVAKGILGHSGVKVVGLHMHLGSPILKTEPYQDGAAKGLKLIEELRKQGHPISVLNMGGGFGIHYRKQEAQPAKAFADVILPVVKQASVGWCWNRGDSLSATRGSC